MTDQELTKKQKNKLWLWLMIIVIFTIGLLAGWKIRNLNIKRATIVEGNSLIIREHENEFKFISPLLAVGDLPELRDFKVLENKVADLIKEAQKKQQIDSAAVYFRDFNTGEWLGVNEDEKYAPASLYKVPWMITYLKISEADPKLLNKEVVYDIDPAKRAEPAEMDAPRIELGKPYTIAELIKRLVIYSDNDAKSILGSIIKKETEEKIFNDLGLKIPDENDTGDAMSPKTFALFFRILYNASYLSRSMSEAALNLLSQVNFKYGLLEGVPKNIVVAHKYGYRDFNPSEQPSTKEFHDCGIVYHPHHPYFLCVMTKGQNADNLKNLIKQISQIVYEAVEADYK